MSFSLLFRNRDFTEMVQPSGVEYEVDRYSRASRFGPLQATVVARGSIVKLWEFAEFLRRPVEITHNERGEPVWWGMLHKVDIIEGNNRFIITLDSMGNKVAVAFTENSARDTTAYSSNTSSTGEYGTFETLLSRRELSAAAAEQLRDTHLDVYKFPQVEYRFSTRPRETRATLTFRGWGDPMRRRYYTNDQGLEQYVVGGDGREIGEDDRPIAAQSFQVSSAAGWTLTEIWLRIWKVGTPTDNLLVSLYDNAAGDPNASIDSAPALAGANVPSNRTWTKFTLSSGTALSTGTDRWIHVARSGGVDASNYYMIDSNWDRGYANGVLKLFSTVNNAWQSKSMDLNFKAVGTVATTTQISNIATASGEFISGIDIEDASGVTTSLNRDGDYTAMKEMTKLLDIGTSNSRRLLADISRSRRLRIYEEDPITTVNYKMDKNRNLRTINGNPVRKEDCLVGVWVELEDFIPPTVDTSILANPSPVFIDESEYVVATDTWSPTRIRGEGDILPTVIDG